MLSYYTCITLLSLAGLSVLCVLVLENGRINKAGKKNFYLTYILIALAALAEWTGVQLNGMDELPHLLLRAVKCADYILTPMSGVALIRQMGLHNRWNTALNIAIAGNAVFQLIACFTGWMVVIDSENRYSHGPLYFVYMIFYLFVIAVVLIEFWIYGKGFARHNRYSLYAIMGMVVFGIALQEFIGVGSRTAYITLTMGAAMMFIHYIEYAQLDFEGRLNEKEKLLLSDTLTGLLSRYAYSQTLTEYDEQGALPQELAVFSIDINGVKTANDTLGHAAGDELIRGAADCIRRVFGANGLCFRTGGDEFIVLTNADLKTAEELLRKLERETKAWDGKAIHSLTVSAGFALACEHKDATAEKLIGFADRVMYTDKNRYYSDSSANV